MAKREKAGSMPNRDNISLEGDGGAGSLEGKERESEKRTHNTRRKGLARQTSLDAQTNYRW